MKAGPIRGASLATRGMQHWINKQTNKNLRCGIGYLAAEAVNTRWTPPVSWLATAAHALAAGIELGGDC